MRQPENMKPGNLAGALVGCDAALETALQHMSNEAALIIDKHGRLCGIVTDGDLRRAFLAGASLETPVADVMTREPLTIREGLGRHEIRSIMVSRSIRHLPVVDAEGRPVDLELLKNLFSDQEMSKAVVMAGGRGTRLCPLTLSKPKPLLKVGDDVILDNVLNGLSRNGVSDVIISINYLGEQIKDHVEDGTAYNLNIRYLEEHKRLGTAGALGLLSPRPTKSIIVMNADLITDLDFRTLCRYHQESGNHISMCVRRHSMSVPYGVVSLDPDNRRVRKLEEKPDYTFLVNAGIYMLRPETLSLIPVDGYYDMVSLIDDAIAAGMTVGAFPILEYWRDIGRPDEMDQATREWKTRHNRPTDGTAANVPVAADTLEIA